MRLMLALNGRCHSCEVISLNPLGPLSALLTEHQIPAKGLPYRGSGGWRSYPLYRSTFRSVHADALLMTGHHLLSMLAFGDLCEGRRLLAIHFHHTGVKPPWQWRLIYRLACKRFKAITFPSDFIREEAEDLYPPLKALSYTVQNPLAIPPVPDALHRARARQALGIPPEAPVVGNAGWLIPRKRFDMFLRVASGVARLVPNALFLIAGDGPERERLEALAADLKIGERVRWIGWQKDLTGFYQSLDVMLFNSDWDAMGLTPLEAMSHAIPLVASVQHGGLKEVVNKDDYGFLIPFHKVDALVERAVFLLQNPDEARKIALAGRARVEAVSRPEEIAAKIESLICGEYPIRQHGA